MPSRALALALAALLVSACAAAADTPATDTAPPPTVTASPFPTTLPIADTPPPEWREYLNDRYHVSLWVPGQWQPLEAGPGFQGADGFVGLTMLGDDGGQITLEAACAAQAYHKLQPFGSAPEVTSVTVSGQPACLIRPSADQPLTANSLPLAEAIVRYPEPVHLDGARYQFLILDADPANIQPLLDRLTLILFDSLNTPTPPAPAAAAPPPPGEAARPAATAAGGCARAHTVQPGEGLAAIGRQYGLSWEAVAEANGLTDPDLIYPGQVLCVPEAANP